MWWSFWHYVRVKRAERAYRNRQKMEADSDILISDSGFADIEEVLETVIEDDRIVFVAATGQFDNDWNIAVLQPELIPKFGCFLRYSALIVESIHSFMSVKSSWQMPQNAPVVR